MRKLQIESPQFREDSDAIQPSGRLSVVLLYSQTRYRLLDLKPPEHIRRMVERSGNLKK